MVSQCGREEGDGVRGLCHNVVWRRDMGEGMVSQCSREEGDGVRGLCHNGVGGRRGEGAVDGVRGK